MVLALSSWVVAGRRTREDWEWATGQGGSVREEEGVLRALVVAADRKSVV